MMRRSVEELIRKDLVLSFFDGEDGSKELLGVWILRFSEVMDLFYDLAMLHDDDVVAEAVCESEVMADEHVGDVSLFLQTIKQIEDGLLDGYVESGGGFVADDDFRLEDEGARDSDTLALAAGHVVRIAVSEVFGKVDQAEHFLRLGFDILLIDHAEVFERFTDDLLDALLRIEGGGGVLEDHLDGFSVLAEGFAFEIGDVLAVENDFPAGHGVEAGEHFGEGGFAGAGFTDDADGFPFVDGDIDVVSGGQLLAVSQVEDFADVDHLEDFFSVVFHASSPPIFGTAARSIRVYSSFG